MNGITQNFDFIDDACNYLSSSGKKGYLELGNTWKSLVIDRKNVVVDGSLPGSDEVMFFCDSCPAGIY